MNGAVKGRRRLDRAQVLRAALRLVDRDGASALTMRGLGRELGVEAMSLYHHVRNREDVLDGLAELMVLSELPVPGPEQPWDEALRAFASGIRRAALRHPDAFRLVGLRPLRSASALASIVGLLRLLRESGFTPEGAVASYRLAAAYARGYALAEIEGLTLAPPHQPAGPPQELREFTDALADEGAEMFDRCLTMVVAGAAAIRGTHHPTATSG